MIHTMTTPHKWTAEELKQAHDLYHREGKSMREIGKHFGISRNAAIGAVHRYRDILARGGVYKKGSKRPPVERPRWPIDPGPNSHPLLRQVFAIMNDRKQSQAEVMEGAGVHGNSFYLWKNYTNPRIDELIAVLNYLGYDLTITELSKNENDDRRGSVG